MALPGERGEIHARRGEIHALHYCFSDGAVYVERSFHNDGEGALVWYWVIDPGDSHAFVELQRWSEETWAAHRKDPPCGLVCRRY